MQCICSFFSQLGKIEQNCLCILVMFKISNDIFGNV